jgi:hypothetical protein
MHTFKFKSYAPEVFKRIRQFCGIDAASYMMSVSGESGVDFNTHSDESQYCWWYIRRLAGNANFIEFMSNSKSGQFFFYSHDGKYMIKTQSKEENRFMKKILPYYYQFLMENPNSLLVRFLGACVADSVNFVCSFKLNLYYVTCYLQCRHASRENVPSETQASFCDNDECLRHAAADPQYL